MSTTVLRLLVAIVLTALPLGAADSGQPIAILATPLPLYEQDPGATRVGRLIYRTGLHLTSEFEDFGGFSGLVIDADGRRLTAVSDQGHWLTAELQLAEDGTIQGLRQASMGPLCDDDGFPVAGWERRDAEEIQNLPGQGLLVSFERHHRIMLYPTAQNGLQPLSVTPRPYPFPPAIVPTDGNKGMEAIAVLKDGRILTFAEEFRTIEGDMIGWVGDPAEDDWQLLTLAADESFLPTGATTLPGGDVVLLERHYSREQGNRIRLRLLIAESLKPGARLAPSELGRIELPATIDNMEAIAMHVTPGGETMIYLLSDDNFSSHQRTLLLQMELADADSR